MQEQVKIASVYIDKAGEIVVTGPPQLLSQMRRCRLEHLPGCKCCVDWMVRLDQIFTYN